MSAVDIEVSEAIRACLPRVIAERMPRFWAFESVCSTNAFLYQQALHGAEGGCVCTAGEQWAGRGRRGKTWISPPGGNLYLSLLWRFDSGSKALSGLSLSAAVAVVQALGSLGARDIGIKWPNDIYWRGAKLGGILVEAGEVSGGCSFVVIGVGVNISLDEGLRGEIDQPVADLSIIHPGISRNGLAAAVITALFGQLDAFEQRGFSACMEMFRQFDILRDRAVQLTHGERIVHGLGRGVNRQGAFCLGIGDAVETFTSGEVSVRGV